MYSIGVDIGTSTTEIIISNIKIATRSDHSMISATVIDDVTVIYKSPIFITPISTHHLIDFGALKKMIYESIMASGINQKDIQTGAVIITGETARKENAAQVSESLAEYLGDFVVATAGPKLESLLAGQGSGMREESKKRNCSILNLDIGGGTLNGVVFNCGESKTAFAMNIGGRIIRFNKDMIVTYISEHVLYIIDFWKIPIICNKIVTIDALELFCECLVECCLQACGLKPMTEEAKGLYITEVLVPDSIDYISVSGGVGEYIGKDQQIKSHEMFEYGDIGPLLGQKLTYALRPCQDKILIPKEKIRATVIGAGCHTLSISGSTIEYEKTILPIRNVPIIKSPVLPENWNDFYIHTIPIKELYEEEIKAVYIQGKTSPGYQELKILAQQIAKLYEGMKSPVIVLLKEDFAKALSQMLRIHANCKKPIICLDHINVDNGDYVDLGLPVGCAVPVIIKTLIYQT